MAVQKEKIKHLNQILCPLVISKRAWVYKWRNKEAMSGMLAIINGSPADFEKLSNAIDTCSDVTANHTLTLIRH